MAGRPLKRARLKREARNNPALGEWEQREVWHLFVDDPGDRRKFLSITLSQRGESYDGIIDWSVKADWGWFQPTVDQVPQRSGRTWIGGTTEEAKQQSVAWASQQAMKL